jgi:hypothetical protein
MAEMSPSKNALRSGVQIDMPGLMGEERRAGGWPNLVGVANLAIAHMNEICNPNHSYRSYVGGKLGRQTASFARSIWNWTEASSYALSGRIGGRRLTGNTCGAEVEIGQRQLTLASFHNLDGFSHRPYAKGWSEDTRVIIWEQARVLFTLMAWFVESQDERLLSYVRGMVQALMGASRREGKFRLLNPPFDRENVFGEVAQIVLVEPLMKYYEITNDPDALDFCEGTIHWAMDPATNFVDGRYRFSGWLRGLAAALASMARFAVCTNDEKLLDRAEGMLRSAVSLTADFGATPDTEPCCTNMELITAALALTEAGGGEWWDMIDRHFRNHMIECQFTDPEAVNEGYLEGEPGPGDDTRDILNRSVGAFTWASAREHRYEGEGLMLCCCGNAMWTLGKIATHAATQDERGLSINLHFSLDTPLAWISNHEPFEGRLEVMPRCDGTVRIRQPAYAEQIEAALDGSPAVPKQEGSYLVFDGVRRNSTIVLTYPMTERTTEEVTRNTPGQPFDAKTDPVVKERIRTTWRGNTVLAIDYDSDSPQPKHRLYLHRMEQYRNGEGQDDTVRFFLPEKPYVW